MRMTLVKLLAAALIAITASALATAQPINAPALGQAVVAITPTVKAWCWIRRWCTPYRCHRRLWCT
jgi:hypothetical protein